MRGRRGTWFAPDVGEQFLLVVDFGVDRDVDPGTAGLACRVAHVGVVGAGGKHHALDHHAHLLLGSGVACCQLADRTVDIGLTPEHRGAVVEEVEIVGVVAFLLHDLKLDVLVVEVIVVALWL